MPTTPILREQPVVGLFFRTPETKDLVRRHAGSSVSARLVPEPTNEHDAHAVAVHAALNGDWIVVGYLPASMSALVALWLAMPEPSTTTLQIKPGKSLPDLLLSITTGT